MRGSETCAPNSVAEVSTEDTSVAMRGHKARLSMAKRFLLTEVSESAPPRMNSQSCFFICCLASGICTQAGSVR
jgi:hypothetical protein